MPACLVSVVGGAGVGRVGEPLGCAAVGWDSATAVALAVASRTPGGLVDPEALARFVAEAPHLDADGPDVSLGALHGLAAGALGHEVVIERIRGGPGEGQSGAPVYLVKDQSGDLVAIAKIFPGVGELVRELSAIHRLSDGEFVRFGTPEVLATAVADLPAGPAGAIVMSVAPGLSVFNMIQDLPALGSPDRPAALARLRQALADSGAALAELHTRPDRSGGPVDRGFLEFNHGLARRETLAVAAYAETLGGLGIDGGDLVTRVDELIEAALAEPGGAAIMHSDAHPGNIFWHPDDGVTLIDTPHSHFSMDGSGAAIGSPARDYSNMVQRLAQFSLWARLCPAETAELRAAFVDAYQRGGGPDIPEAARNAFAARFAVRDLLDTLTALELAERGADDDRDESRRTLRRQLRDEAFLLKAVLGWSRDD